MDPLCDQRLLDTVSAGDVGEVQRLTAVLGQNVNCRASSHEYLLQMTLRLSQQAMSYFIASTLPPGCPHISVRNATGATPLLMAADKGYCNVVGVLVGLSVDVLARDSRGNTALLLAAPYATCSALVIAQLNSTTGPGQLLARDMNGNLPLHRALIGVPGASVQDRTAVGTQIYRAAMALASEPDILAMVDAANNAGDRPSHLTGDLTLLVGFRTYGAHMGLDVRNSAGATPLHSVAAVSGSAASGAMALVAAAANVKVPVAVSRLLVASSESVDVTDNLLRTPLHYAARGGDPGNCQWLIKAGADTGFKDASGATPLAYGLSFGQRQLVTAFAGTAGGAPLDAVVVAGRFDLLQQLVLQPGPGGFPAAQLDNTTGRSGIYRAAELGRLDMLGFFISQGVNLTHLDLSGLTVLAAAAAAAQDASMRLLLQRGAPPDQRLRNDSTALMIAAASGCGPCIEVLVAAGADVNAVDLRGLTALHRCTSGPAAEALLRLGAASIPTPGLGLLPVHTTAYAGQAEALKVILAWRTGGGGAAGATTATGETPLHLAAGGGSLEAARVLLTWCADVHAVNADGRTPDEYATKQELATLLREGSMMEGSCTCDCGPYTPGPLYFASGWAPGCTAAVQCLLGAGGMEQVQCVVPAAVKKPGHNITHR